MHYLLLTIVSSVLVATFIKLSEKSDCNRIVVAAVNYFVALLASLVLAAYSGVWSVSPATLMVGIYGGITWVAGLLLMMYAVKTIGVAITSAVARLSVVLPIILSIAIFSEFPGILKYLGIIAAIIAVLLLSLRPRKDGKRFELGYVITLLAVWLAGGGAEFAGKLFAVSCPADQKYVYLCILFATAFTITLSYTVVSGKKMSKKDAAYGCLIGIPNALSGLFVVSALIALDAVLVYPTIAVGTVVIVTLLGVAVWKEKVRAIGYAGILLAIAALILVNME